MKIIWDVDVAGSNPVAPTIEIIEISSSLNLFCEAAFVASKSPASPFPNDP